MTRSDPGRNVTVQAMKLLFLLVICYGHIHQGGADGGSTPGPTADPLMQLWWVPGDVGLFFFAATSAYFTSVRYADPQRMGGYWSRKVPRVFGLFLFLNLVLGAFFIVTGRPGVFTWHTLVNLAGLNGFLNWFGIRNESPFGAGQWFFTLLLLFYAAYPLMSRRVTTPRTGHLLLAGSIAVAAVMQYVSPYGYSLWSTAVGFVAGFWHARFVGKGMRGGLAVLAAACVFAAAYRALGHAPVAAYAIIGMLGYALAALSLHATRPPQLGWLVLAVGDILLPLYIIHSYFRLPFTALPYLDSLLVLLMNVALAKLFMTVYARLVAACHRVLANAVNAAVHRAAGTGG
ncbi:acyltransferase family protein [Nitratidesulfovibrio sp.]|uniref:acyltransferase family protein n=1 Tax=Nitratidesulfovibrio sp. TaxID=2802297 RepID=UPI00333F5A97